MILNAVDALDFMIALNAAPHSFFFPFMTAIKNSACKNAPLDSGCLLTVKQKIQVPVSSVLQTVKPVMVQPNSNASVVTVASSLMIIDAYIPVHL